MSGTITPYNTEILKELIMCGVVRDIDPSSLPAGIGGLTNACSDGHHFPHMISTYQKAVGECKICHTAGLNGGGFMLDPNLAYNQVIPVDRVLLSNHVGGMILKGVFHNTLFAHTPCGMANLFGMTLVGEIYSLLQGKYFLKKMARNPTYIQTLVSLLDCKKRLALEQHTNAVRLFSEPELVKVACLLQVNFPHDEKRVFFVSGKAFNEWRTGVGASHQLTDDDSLITTSN